MNSRTLIAALGITAAIGAPLAALAHMTWETTNDGAGSRMVITNADAPGSGALAAHFAAMHPGHASPGRHYAPHPEQAGWHSHMMQHCLDGDRPARFDDMGGHMPAAETPPGEQQSATFEQSGGG